MISGVFMKRESEESLSEKYKGEYRSNPKKTEEFAPKYILPIPVEDYVDSAGKELSDFKFRIVGVDIIVKEENLEKTILKGKGEMIDRAKKLGAEVVVDFRSNYFPFYMVGIALIPKK